jgi:sulfane dehydrogenase subunit SoxC
MLVLSACGPIASVSAAQRYVRRWGQIGGPCAGLTARLVVPGYYGTNSVKWLTRLTLAHARAAGPFTTRWYNDPVQNTAGQSTGATVPVGPIAPESVIVSPAPDQTLAIGVNAEIWGWAWADGGVSAIDIGTDRNSGWTPATIEPPAGRAWQRFASTWSPGRSGKYELRSRARSPDGRYQPFSGARNAIRPVPVIVV